MEHIDISAENDQSQLLYTIVCLLLDRQKVERMSFSIEELNNAAINTEMDIHVSATMQTVTIEKSKVKETLVS